MQSAGKRIRREAASFRKFALDRDNRRTILMIVIAVLLLMLIQVLKSMLSGGVYITSDGEVSGVMRDDVNRTVSFPLTIEADKDGEKRRKNVTLTITAEKVKEKEDSEPGTSEETLFESEVSELLSRLSEKGGKKIMLPKTLEDGTKLIWKKGQSGTELMLILLAPLFIWMLYLDQEKKKREKVRERTASIERELPAFNDQLVLLLGSGLILREAFRRIAEGYRVKKVRTYFEDRIVKIWEETENGVSDFVNVLTRTSDDIGVSEFSRIAGVIRDNQLRGFDISGKLAAESEILWDLRKKNAEERGRLAETKLTMPLAILLIVLVLVTAAPAIIQVQGG